MTSEPEVSVGTRRTNCFDFLRLVAASVVVVAHAQTNLYSGEVLWNLWSLVDGIGMFFIMSGMLVYGSGVAIWGRTGRWVEFFRNRYLRIAPGIYSFAVVTPLLLVVTGLVGVATLTSRQLVVWLGSAFWLLPNYHPSIWSRVGTGNLNGQLYTIPAEISFYLIVPLLVLTARRWGFNVMLAGLVVLSVAGSLGHQYAPGPIPNVLHHTFLERCGYFTAGVLFSHYWPRIRQTWTLWGIASAVYLALKQFGPGHELYAALGPVLLAIPLGYSVVFFGYHGPRFLRAVTEKVGDLSFGTYIWHGVIINAFIAWGWAGHQWEVGVALACAWVLAAVSWRHIESQALRLKRVSLQQIATGARRRRQPSTL